MAALSLCLLPSALIRHQLPLFLSLITKALLSVQHRKHSDQVFAKSLTKYVLANLNPSLFWAYGFFRE